MTGQNAKGLLAVHHARALTVRNKQSVWVSAVFCLFTGIFLVACSDKPSSPNIEDETPPAVTMISPTYGRQVALSETISIIGNVESDLEIASIEVGVAASTTSDYNSIVFEQIPPAVGIFNYSFSPKAHQLSVGEYTVFVKVTDAIGQTSHREVAITIIAPTIALLNKPAEVTPSNNIIISFLASPGLTNYTCVWNNEVLSTCTSPLVFEGLAEGDYTLIIKAYDEDGVEYSVSYTFSVNFGPKLEITAAPDLLSYVHSGEIGFYSKDVSAIVCQLNETMVENCTSPFMFTDLPDGDYLFSVAGQTAQGLLSVNHSWQIATPGLTITQQPSAISNAIDAVIEFVAIGVVDTYCELLGLEPAAPCQSPKVYTNLPDGDYSVEVTAPSIFGELFTQTVSWQQNAQPPVLQLVEKPALYSKQKQGVKFIFTADDPTTTFTCDLDNKGVTPCNTGTKTYNNLNDGSHTFTLRGVDQLQQVSVLTYTWQVDTQAPNIVLLSHPATFTDQLTATFTFSTEPGVNYICQLDNQSIEACSSPKIYQLTEGQHQFTAEAIDLAGNTTQLNTFYWEILQPSIVFTQHPATLTSFNQPKVAFTTNDLTAVYCTLDGPVAEGPFLCNNAWQSNGNLPDGEYSFTVSGPTLMNTLVEAGVTWTQDTLPPTILITGKPINPTVDTGATFSFTADDPNAVFSCKLDDGLEQDCSSGLMIYNGPLTEGLHTFSISAEDLLGQTSGVSYVWDVLYPNITITISPKPATNDTTPSFAFTNHDVNQTYCAIIGVSGPQVCNGSINYNNALVNGQYSFQVSATTAANTVVSQTFNWRIDTVPPVVILDSWPQAATNVATFTYHADPAELSFPVTYECALTWDGNNTVIFAPCGNGEQVYNSLASNSTYDFWVRAIDAAGNIGSAAVHYNFSIDTEGPTVTIDNFPPSMTDQTGVSIVFSSKTPDLAYFECSFDDAPYSVCTSSYFHYAYHTGEHQFRVRGVDTIGNRGSSAFDEYTLFIGAIAAGLQHSCAVTDDHKIWCWGNNEEAQVGNGSFNNASRPQREATLGTDWLKISSKTNQTCAIDMQQGLFCWGASAFNNVTQPTTIGDPNWKWRETAAGDQFACAIRDDHTLWCWGINDDGQLAIGGNTSQENPKQEKTASTQWWRLAAGKDHACAIKTDYTLWCWGDNTFGQLGLGNTGLDQTTPVQEANAATDWVQVTAGDGYTCGLKNNGSLWCWGKNQSGQLGNGATTLTLVPTEVDQAGTPWVKVAGGFDHTCAMKADATLWCWGKNDMSQLGDGTTTLRTLPVQEQHQDQNWTDVAVGGSHTCGARTNAGVFHCWGSVGSGQLGIGVTENYLDAPMAAVSDGNWIQVAAGSAHTCAVKTDGRLLCWGENNSGQLGVGSSIDTMVPTQEASLATNWSDVIAGGDFSCGFKYTSKNINTLWCWGNNSSGQLGIATTNSTTLPTQAVQGGHLFAQFTAGLQHVCGITIDGQLLCWGNNQAGQIGLGTQTNGVLIPTFIDQANNWLKVSAGYGHTCAVKTDNTLWCWGNNTYGQLGIGSYNDVSAPTQIGTETAWQDVAAGSSHSCASKMDNTVWCWGSNAYGQLALNSTTSVSEPTQEYHQFSQFTSLALGQNTSCVTVLLGVDQFLACAGYNYFGQLGIGSTQTALKFEPEFSQSTSWSTQVAAGGYHTCALQANGNLLCWGYNGSGQLGFVLPSFFTDILTVVFPP